MKTPSTFSIINKIDITDSNRTAINEIYPFEAAANMTLEKFDLSDENIRS